MLLLLFGCLTKNRPGPYMCCVRDVRPLLSFLSFFIFAPIVVYLHKNKISQCWGGGNDTLHNYGQLGQGSMDDVGIASGQMGDALPEIDFGSGRTAVDLAAGWTHT